MGSVGRHILHILKNIQFACPRMNFCIWAMALLMTDPPVLQQGRKNAGLESLQGQTGNQIFAVPVMKCLHSHYCFFPNWWVLHGLLWQDFCVFIIC